MCHQRKLSPPLLADMITTHRRSKAFCLNKPIDEEKLNVLLMRIRKCSEMDAPPYTGVPAPVLQNDEWFEDCPKAKEYVQEMKSARFEKSFSVEPKIFIR